MPVSEKSCRMRRTRQVPPGFCPRRGTYTAGSARAASGSARGCKGRSPLHEITLILPFPPGRALCERGRGMGLQKQTKGRVGRRQTRQATPSGTGSTCPGERTISNAEVPLPGPPPPWLPALLPIDKQNSLVVQVPLPAQARGCKGRSPLHKKKNPPFPGGEGVGGWGRKSN